MSFEIPTIRTEGLILRAPKLDDFDALCAYYQDPRSAFNGGPREPLDVGRMLMICVGQWHLRGHGLWHITLKDNDTFIGFAGIFHPMDWPEPELGYGITAPFEGKGIAFEAAMAARTATASHCGLTNLPSFISPDNTRSQALAQRMAAVRETDITLRDKTAQVYRHPKTEAA
jgi:RimJ/RimL family protein N-acetyltransferase